MGLRHPQLAKVGVRHGFGIRGDVPPADLMVPRQVHGAAVVRARDFGDERPEADAIVAVYPTAMPVGVVTADCVPVLVASADGSAVAAIHAGWRGLAAGVIEAGIEALRAEAPAARWVAGIGPHIGACCYEIDAPVTEGLRPRHAATLDSALRASRSGHWQLDLGALARASLERVGLDPDDVGVLEGTCTACDVGRFHSYRRDGPRSGRLVHWIRARERKEITS